MRAPRCLAPVEVRWRWWLNLGRRVRLVRTELFVSERQMRGVWWSSERERNVYHIKNVIKKLVFWREKCLIARACCRLCFYMYAVCFILMVYVSVTFWFVFYTSRKSAMSGHLENGVVAVGGNNENNSLGNSGWTPFIAKQHNYKQIDHVHSLLNDLSNLYLDDRLDYPISLLFIIFFYLRIVI